MVWDPGKGVRAERRWKATRCKGLTGFDCGWSLLACVIQWRQSGMQSQKTDADIDIELEAMLASADIDAEYEALVADYSDALV